MVHDGEETIDVSEYGWECCCYEKISEEAEYMLVFDLTVVCHGFDYLIEALSCCFCDSVVLSARERSV